MIAALFVQTDGCYFGLDGVDPWDVTRDARKYNGPWPVVAHPPCERWGRYWSGGPSARERKKLGDDDGCFASALVSLWRFGGVLEHPEASHAWRYFKMLAPPRHGGWMHTSFCFDAGPRHAVWGYGFTCCVEQGHYGHPARKATWLLTSGIGAYQLPELKWGPSQGRRLDAGFHSKEEARAARSRPDYVPPKRLSKAENIATPIPFRDLLLSIARTAQRRTEAA